MSMRWISEVPSKMVKIVDVGAVSAGQRPARGRGISTGFSTGCPRVAAVSGRPAYVVDRGSDAGQEGTVDLVADLA
jgi:cysteine synthase